LYREHGTAGMSGGCGRGFAPERGKLACRLVAKAVAKR
jgi:hypothetical protein